MVWRVISEPAQISQWFSDTAEIDLRPGGGGTLVFGERSTIAEITADRPATVNLVVESVEPPNRLSFRWAHPDGTRPDETNSLLVEFTLSTEGDNTRLHLVESGYTQIDWPEERRTEMVNEHEKGWNTHLGRLRDYASGQRREPARAGYRASSTARSRTA